MIQEQLKSENRLKELLILSLTKMHGANTFEAMLKLLEVNLEVQVRKKNKD